MQRVHERTVVGSERWRWQHSSGMGDALGSGACREVVWRTTLSVVPTHRDRAAGADVVASWFLSPTERGNRATDIRAWTTGNAVEVLVDGAKYFGRLHQELC